MIMSTDRDIAILQNEMKHVTSAVKELTEKFDTVLDRFVTKETFEARRIYVDEEMKKLSEQKWAAKIISHLFTAGITFLVLEYIRRYLQ